MCFWFAGVCPVCCAREQSMALRGLLSLPDPGCPLAVLARRGFLGRHFAFDTEAVKKKFRSKSSYGSLGLSDVFKNGKFNSRGPQCDAADFMVALLQELAVAERGLEGYDEETSRCLFYELFGFIHRTREHCLVEGCRFTRDCCSRNYMNVQLLVSGCPESVVTLEAVSYTHLTLPTIYSV